MTNLFRSLFGYYQPIQFLVSGDPNNGTAVYEPCINWPYILSVLLFALVLYSFFRLLGIILGGSNR